MLRRTPRSTLFPYTTLFHLSTNTRQRDSSAPVNSKLGFSVVAPMRVTTPFSTQGRKASCCARLKRWISSQKRRSEEHTSELQSHSDLVCRLLLEKKKNTTIR